MPCGKKCFKDAKLAFFLHAHSICGFSDKFYNDRKFKVRFIIGGNDKRMKENLTRDCRGKPQAFCEAMKPRKARCGGILRPKKEKKCAFISVFDFFLLYKFGG